VALGPGVGERDKSYERCRTGAKADWNSYVAVTKDAVRTETGAENSESVGQDSELGRNPGRLMGFERATTLRERYPLVASISINDHVRSVLFAD
jgi:hypothetical protein